MDIATLIGFVVGFALVIVSILMGSPLGAFVNAPGIVIVFGGTLCAALVSERLGNVLGSVKVALKTFKDTPPQIDQTISQVGELSAVVRKEGLLALENTEISDPFLARGIRLAVDGVPHEEIQTTLRAELVSLKQRHKRAQKLFRFMAATGPSMGMIGTLIGLVQMLRALDNPSSIGPAMAVALLTTLYGAIIAFMVCGPVADKLEHRTNEETANMVVVIEGIDSILKGENQRLVEEKLQGYLAPNQRNQLEAA